MKNLLKKISLFFLSFLILISSYLTILAPSVQAQSTWYNSSLPEWFLKVYDENTSPPNEIFGERYTAAQVQWIIYSLATFPFVAGSGIGKDVIICAITKDLGDCATVIKDFIDKTNETSSADNNQWFANIGTNQISGIGYVSRLMGKFSLVPEAKAQGFGFQSGNFSQFLWQISRNIAYFFLVIVVIVLAFMIMFRVKLNPQTVISVQTALPKIIIAMILITFSYAIAGFAIDLVYVIIGLISSIVVQNNLTTFDMPTIFRSLTTGKNAFTLLFQYWILFLGGAMGHIFSGVVVGGVIMLIFAILSIFILIFYSIKIVFMLLKTFINVNLLIITAPFQILLGTIFPGAGFGPWFKKLISQLLVYPVTGLMFFLAFLFLRQVYPAGDFWTKLFVFNVTQKVGATVWDPPLTVGTGTGAFSGIWLVLLAMSFGIIAMIPKTVEIIQAFMAGKEFAGSALGEILSPIRTTGMMARDIKETARVSGATINPKVAAVLDKLKWLSSIPQTK